MVLKKKGPNIGKAIAEKVRGFPVFKKVPKKQPTRWVLCPEMKIKAPKKLKALTREEANRDYNYFVWITTESRNEATAMLDIMIKHGSEGLETNGVKFWLHAVRKSIERVGQLYRVKLTYIFRIEQISEEIS